MQRRPILNPTAPPAGFTVSSRRRIAATVGAAFQTSSRKLSPLAWSMLVILAVALAARLFALGTKPYWLDEVFTIFRSSLPLGDLLTDSLRNRHLPSFFLIEHALLNLGGGPAMLRLTPALAGAVTAPLTFAIAWKLGGRAAAWLAGLLMALAPSQVAFGQEARSYTLMMALILLALLGLTTLATKPEAGAKWFTQPGALSDAWAAYALGTVGALLVLGDAWPWLIAANVAMAAGILPRTKAWRGLLRNWLVVQALVLLIALPCYAVMLARVHGHVLQSFLWIPPLSLASAWLDVASLYGLRSATMVSMHLLPAQFAGLTLLLFALAGFGAWRLRGKPGPLIVLVIAFLGLPATLALISLLHPVLLPRYLLWSVGPFFVLAGFGIEMIPERLRRPALAVAALVAVANLLPYYSAETKPRWDRAAEILALRFAPGDLLLVSDGATPVMLDFNRQGPKPLHSAWPATRDPKEAAARLAAGHRVFAVYGPAGQGKQPDRASFFAAVAKLGHPAAPLAVGSEIIIQEIAPPAAGPAVASPSPIQPRA
ncbi:MAG: glycosyltransferase family 39 protein [Acetobacteraceae bacterium]